MLNVEYLSMALFCARYTFTRRSFLFLQVDVVSGLADFLIFSGFCSSSNKESRRHNESHELGVCYSREERGKVLGSCFLQCCWFGVGHALLHPNTSSCIC